MVDRKFGLGVFVCVFNSDFSKILFVKRNEEKRKKHGADWGNVGGKVEPGEKLLNACIREAKEEIGIDLDPENVKLIEIKESPFLTENIHALHFVYSTVLDEDAKIIVNEESDGYQWFDLKNLPEKTLDTKEDLIKWSKIAQKNNP